MNFALAMCFEGHIRLTISAVTMSPFGLRHMGSKSFESLRTHLAHSTQYCHPMSLFPTSTPRPTHMLPESRLILIYGLDHHILLVLGPQVLLDLVEVLDSGAGPGSAVHVSASVVRATVLINNAFPTA